jgi:hypothetical protein
MALGLNPMRISGGGGGGNYSGLTGEIRDIMQPYYQRYIDAGGRALPQLEGQYGRLLDPSAFLKSIGAGYQQSPGYQFNVNEATRASNQAAAAGGMLGTPAQQQALAQRISDISSKDYGDYMQRAMGAYGMGLQGLGGLNQMGYDASTGLAGNLGNARLSEYQSELYRKMMEDQEDDGFFGGLGKAFGAIGGFGSALGGLSSGITGFKNLFGSKDTESPYNRRMRMGY